MNEKCEIEDAVAEQRTRVENAQDYPQWRVQVSFTPDQAGLRLGLVNPKSTGKRKPALVASEQCRPIKKQDFRLFKTLAARCAVSVKSKYPDMKDCHSASLSLVEVLRSRGYADAMVIGCTVLTGTRDAITTMLGELDTVDRRAHSVVMVGGCLIDATAGQFRDDQIRIPDYLVLPGHVAIPMLKVNRRYMEAKAGEVFMHSIRNGALNFLIAYIPTDPRFNIR